MIYKFWNVRLVQCVEGLEIVECFDDFEIREKICDEEEWMEEKVFCIWSVFLIFEELLVVCIFDMFFYVSNGVYVDGVFVVKWFIWYVEIFFQFIDRFDMIMVNFNGKGRFIFDFILNFDVWV